MSNTLPATRKPGAGWSASPRSFPDAFVSRLLVALCLVAAAAALAVATRWIEHEVWGPALWFAAIAAMAAGALVVCHAVNTLRRTPSPAFGEGPAVIEMETDPMSPHISKLFDRLDQAGDSEIIGIDAAIGYATPCVSLLLDADNEICGTRYVGFLPHVAIRDWDSGSITERSLTVLERTEEDAIRRMHEVVHGES